MAASSHFFPPVHGPLSSTDYRFIAAKSLQAYFSIALHQKEKICKLLGISKRQELEEEKEKLKNILKDHQAHAQAVESLLSLVDSATHPYADLFFAALNQAAGLYIWLLFLTANDLDNPFSSPPLILPTLAFLYSTFFTIKLIHYGTVWEHPFYRQLLAAYHRARTFNFKIDNQNTKLELINFFKGGANGDIIYRKGYSTWQGLMARFLLKLKGLLGVLTIFYLLAGYTFDYFCISFPLLFFIFALNGDGHRSYTALLAACEEFLCIFREGCIDDCRSLEKTEKQTEILLKYLDKWQNNNNVMNENNSKCHMFDSINTHASNTKEKIKTAAR